MFVKIIIFCQRCCFERAYNYGKKKIFSKKLKLFQIMRVDTEIDHLVYIPTEKLVHRLFLRLEDLDLFFMNK